MCSQGTSDGIEAWDTGMGWGKKGWKRRSLWSLGDWVKEKREATAGFSYRAGDETGEWILGMVGEVWVHLHPICCPGRSGPWVSSQCLLDLVWGLRQSDKLGERG